MRKHPVFTWHGFQVTIHDLLLFGCFVGLLVAIGILVTNFLTQVDTNHRIAAKANRTALQAKRLAKQARQDHIVLCAIRSQRRRDVRSSVQFLERHPNGGLGFTEKEILDSIHKDQQTLRSMDVLVCK